MKFTVVDHEPDFHSSSHPQQGNPLKQAVMDLKVGQWLKVPPQHRIRSVRTMVSTLQNHPSFERKRAFTVRKDRVGTYWIGRLPDPGPRTLAEIFAEEEKLFGAT